MEPSIAALDGTGARRSQTAGVVVTTYELATLRGEVFLPARCWVVRPLGPLVALAPITSTLVAATVPVAVMRDRKSAFIVPSYVPAAEKALPSRNSCSAFISRPYIGLRHQ